MVLRTKSGGDDEKRLHGAALVRLHERGFLGVNHPRRQTCARVHGERYMRCMWRHEQHAWGWDQARDCVGPCAAARGHPPQSDAWPDAGRTAGREGWGSRLRGSERTYVLFNDPVNDDERLESNSGGDKPTCVIRTGTSSPRSDLRRGWIKSNSSHGVNHPRRQTLCESALIE